MTVTPIPDPSRLVAVDVSNGFLAKRATALKLRPDGTLESFNASRTGHGGAVIQSVLKLGVSLATSGMFSVNVVGQDEPAPPRRSPELVACNPRVLALLEEEARLDREIPLLEDRVLLGSATSADLQLLERRRARRSDVRKGLTLSASIEAKTPSGDAMFDRLEPLAYQRWFAPVSVGGFDQLAIPGAAGWAVAVTRDIARYDSNQRLGSVENEANSTQAEARLLYLRPVPATINTWSCAPVAADKEACLESSEPGASAAAGHDELVVPQWSALHRLSVGRGGIFGSRELSAKFDPYGAPLELSYGSESGSSDIAATVDGATAAVADLRDREMQSLERRIKLEEARKKLRELETAE